MDFHQLSWRALHFAGMVWGLGQISFKKKKSKILFPVSECIRCSNAISSHARIAQVSRVQYNCIFSIHGPRLSRCLCAGSGSGADGASPAGPARCRVPCRAGLAPAAVSSKTWRGTCTKVYVFLSDPATVSGKRRRQGLWAPRGSGDGISSS